MQTTKNNKKSRILLLCGIVALLACVAIYFSSKDPNSNFEIRQLVDKYNTNCPLLIQVGVRLDSVSLPKEQAVQYNLTLLNIEKQHAEIEIIKDNIEESLVSTAKANPGLQTFRENQFTLIYSYKDKNKASLFEVIIKPEQYK